jgi:type IV pilus assembly protein PilB
MEGKKLNFTSPASFTVRNFFLLIGEKGEEESFPLSRIQSWQREKQGAHHELSLALTGGGRIIIRGLPEKRALACIEVLKEALEERGRIFSVPTSIMQVKDRYRELFPLSGDNDEPEVLLDYLVIQACHLGASDIHFKPERASIAVYFRIDGLLSRILDVSTPLYDRFLVFAKNSSRLMAYKKSVPQDGRLSYHSGEKEMDLRIAMLPTLFGERTVIRLLSTRTEILSLHALGFHEAMLRSYRTLIRKPQGLILLTGPAGSGKTTTIFSSLLDLTSHCRDNVNISTIEDPIEYMVEQFSQTQVNPAMGLTFASGLRTLLRQDPNIILVGEIRDEETAAIALQASLSGHLVFSTLHSTGALGVFPRLMDMRIEPYLVSAAITGVIYQRLVRTLCRECSHRASLTPSLTERFARYEIKTDSIMTAKGCDACNGSGYRGRTGAFELLEVTTSLQELLHRRASSRELFEAAAGEGFKTLDHDMLMKVAEGVTGGEELERLSL